MIQSFVKKSHAEGGSWGGPECAAHLSWRTHLIESSFVCSCCMMLFMIFRLGDRFNDHYMIIKMNMLSLKYRANGWERLFDNLLATICLGMYAQLVYYKFNCSSLISLIQPCHVIMLLEGIALASDGPTGTIIATFILPALSGTFLGILFPDVSGLDQPFEELSYWIQHYLIIVIPIYLLLRKNGLALDMSSSYTIAFGLWILTILHFSFFEIIDLVLHVNVEFMLCPTGTYSLLATKRTIKQIPSDTPSNKTHDHHRMCLAMTHLYMTHLRIHSHTHSHDLLPTRTLTPIHSLQVL